MKNPQGRSVTRGWLEGAPPGSAFGHSPGWHRGLSAVLARKPCRPAFGTRRSSRLRCALESSDNDRWDRRLSSRFWSVSTLAFRSETSPAYRVLFPASHLQPYERSTEGGLFGSIGFYHL